MIICNEIGWLTSHEFPILIKGSKADDPLPVFPVHPSILFDQSLNLSNTPHIRNKTQTAVINMVVKRTLNYETSSK